MIRNTPTPPIHLVSCYSLYQGEVMLNLPYENVPRKKADEGTQP